MKLCGIYLITHTATGRKYVGQSVDIKLRWSQHAKGKCKMRLGQTIAKHGWKAFSTSILELCDRDELNQAESKWIEIHNCISPHGFNLTAGGGAYKLSDESCKKIAISKLNISAETRAKLSLASSKQTWTEEAKAKISAANAIRVFTDEMRQRLSISHTGKSHTKESRAKMSLAQSGRVISAEARALISKSLTGRKLNHESIAKRTATQAKNRLLKLSLGLPSKNISDESRARMSAAAKKRTPEHYAKVESTKRANRLLRQRAAIPAAGDLFTHR